MNAWFFDCASLSSHINIAVARVSLLLDYMAHCLFTLFARPFKHYQRSQVLDYLFCVTWDIHVCMWQLLGV